MTDLPPLPTIGATVMLHGGTITRVGVNRFVVMHANGKRECGCNRSVKPEIRFLTSVNALRKQADLEPFHLPCLHCLDKPRRGKNAFCCQQCEALHYGREPRPYRATSKTRSYTPRKEQPMPPREAILATLSKLVEASAPKPEPVTVEAVTPHKIQPSLRVARLKADALIQRRQREMESVS